LVFNQNPLIAKTTLLWGDLIIEKRESFWLFIKSNLERYIDLPKQSVFDIEIGK
jgi:hypothetical protein